MTCEECGSACQGRRCKQCEDLAAGRAMFEASRDDDQPDDPEDVTAWGDADE